VYGPVVGSTQIQLGLSIDINFVC